MKNKIPSVLVLALVGTALALAGCNKQERADASADVQKVAHDTKVAVIDAWADIKTFTFEKRDDFSKHVKAMSADMDVRVAELRTSYSEAKASASRRAAMDELKSSEADYKEKLSALGTATADTWDAAKNNVKLSWDRLEASYKKARAN